MKFEELKKQFEMQQEQLSTLLSQNEQLAKDNEKLKSDTELQAQIEHGRKVAEYSAIKETFLDAVKTKGVSKPVRESVSTVLDSLEEKFTEGTITRDLFDAMTKVVDELKPKVEPGRVEDNDDDEDEFQLKEKFTGEEAVNAAMPY